MRCAEHIEIYPIQDSSNPVDNLRLAFGQVAAGETISIDMLWRFVDEE